MTTTNTRLAELQKLRAERKEPDDLPRSLTTNERATYINTTNDLDHQIRSIRTAADALNAIDITADTTWRDHLVTWRATLCGELLSFKSPLRDKELKAQADRITFCLKLIDRGFGVSTLPITDLSSLRLGELMHAAGYQIQGEGLRSARGWRGSLPEVEQRLKLLTTQRTAAEKVLDSLLVTDADRAKQEAESAAHREMLRTMVLKLDGTGRGLQAFDLDDNPLPLADMTDAQRSAFTRFAAVACPTAAPLD